jgi:hypothetical protein
MLAGRRQPELVIESGHTVNVNSGNSEVFGNFGHGFTGKVSQTVLDLLQYGYQVVAFPPEAFKDLPGYLPVALYFLSYVFPVLNIHHRFL